MSLSSCYDKASGYRFIFETLEGRELLAADIGLTAAGGIIDVVGDRLRSDISISVEQESFDGSKVVNDGTTSVFLDVALIESVTDLTLSSLNGTAAPAAGDFQVGFDITETSDFVFNEDNGFLPIFGTIKHTGTVGFNNDSLFVGDFDIIFDAARAVGGNSGFAVVNTIDNILDNLVLFDIAAPGGLNIGVDNLDILDADLRISAEFGTGLVDLGLADTNLTNATVGNAQINADIASFVSSGTTSVFLDLELLANAANLNLSGADSDGTPFSEDFIIGFPITETSDFRLDSGGIIGGTIKHTGTVEFNNALTVGNFDITALGNRGAGNSGLVVISRAEGALNGVILFDIANPGGLDVDSDSLSITEADLRVSPEFAAVLADPDFAGIDLTGTVVGNARVDASLGEVILDTVTVDGMDRGRFQTTVNGDSEASVTVRGFEALNIDVGGGADRVRIDQSEIRGDLNINTGNGSDRVRLLRSNVSGDLNVDTGNGNDRINLLRAGIGGNVTISTGFGKDFVAFLRSEIDGDTNVDTGANNDRFISTRTIFGGDNVFTLGSGNDTLRSVFSQYNGTTVAQGDDGRDRFFSLFDDFEEFDHDNFEWSVRR